MTSPFGSGASSFSFGQPAQTSQPQQTPAFNFSQPSGGNVTFGSAQATQQPAFGGFGAATNQQTAPQFGSFGSQQTNPATTSTTALQFGGLPSSTAPAPAPAFGGFGAATPFGSVAPNATMTFGMATPGATSTPVKGFTSQTTKPSTFSSFGGGSIFGSATTTTTSNSGFGFAGTAVPGSMVANQAPSPITGTPVFGGFGGLQQTPATQTTLGFGASSSVSTAPFAMGTQATSATQQFPAAGSIFRAQTTATPAAAPAAPSIFGTTTTSAAPSFGFGGAQTTGFGMPATQPVATATGISFGQTPSTVMSSTAATAKPSWTITPLNMQSSTSSAPSVITATPSEPASSATGFQMPMGTTQISAVPNLATSSVPAFGPFGGIKFGATPMSTPASTIAAVSTTTGPVMTFDTLASTSTPATSSVPATTTTSMISSFAFPTLAKSTASASTASTTPTPSISSIFSTPTTVSTMTSMPMPSFSLTSLSSAASTTTTSSTLTPATLVGTGLSTSIIPSTTTVTSSVSGGTPGVNFRQLEEMINKWTLDLEEQEKTYLNQATQVNAWDRMLTKNGEKITHLNDSLERVKLDQEHLEHEIDFIVAQQKELEDLLVPLEQKVEQMPALSVQQHADLEREHTYELAENIDAQMKRMAEDLKEIIDHLNASNNMANEMNDPFYKVSKILNAHMDSLQWIEQNTNLIQRKLEDVSQQYELRRKDQERRFRLAYD